LKGSIKANVEGWEKEFEEFKEFKEFKEREPESRSQEVLGQAEPTMGTAKNSGAPLMLLTFDVNRPVLSRGAASAID
jgi:hypothetical protein